MRNQGRIYAVKQVPRRVLSCGVGIHDQPGFVIIQRSEIYSVLFGICAGVAGGEKKKVLTVGQKTGPAGSRMLGGNQRGRRFSSPPQGFPFHHPAGIVCCEQNDVANSPGAATRIGRISKSDNWTAIGRNLHELATGEKADVATVGGPEGGRRPPR